MNVVIYPTYSSDKVADVEVEQEEEGCYSVSQMYGE